MAGFSEFLCRCGERLYVDDDAGQMHRHLGDAPEVVEDEVEDEHA